MSPPSLCLCRRIRSLTLELGALSEPNLEDRMYQVLVNLAQQVGQPRPRGWSIEFPLSHEEIGFLEGAHPVNITRVMARLRESGKIRVEGKRIDVMEVTAG
jgi:CRP/FNR family transcriptional regulator